MDLSANIFDLMTSSNHDLGSGQSHSKSGSLDYDSSFWVPRAILLTDTCETIDFLGRGNKTSLPVDLIDCNVYISNFNICFVICRCSTLLEVIFKT